MGVDDDIPIGPRIDALDIAEIELNALAAEWEAKGDYNDRVGRALRVLAEEMADRSAKLRDERRREVAQ